MLHYLKEKVSRGDLAASAAYEIAKAGSEEDKEQLAARVVGQKLSRDAVASRSQQKTGAASRPASPRLAASLPGGRIITFSGTAVASVDDIIEWLEELLGKARKARPRGMEPATFAALLRDEAKAAAVARSKGRGQD